VQLEQLNTTPAAVPLQLRIFALVFERPEHNLTVTNFLALDLVMWVMPTKPGSPWNCARSWEIIAAEWRVAHALFCVMKFVSPQGWL